MTAQSTLDRLIALIAEAFGANAARLGPNDDLFETLGINSLQALDLLSRLEEAFDIEIPDYALQDVHTFAGLAEVVERRL